MWEVAVHLADATAVCGCFFLSCPFFQRDVLDELLDLVGLVSEGFPTYPFQRVGSFYIASNDKKAFFISDADRNYNLLSCQKVWNSHLLRQYLYKM